MTDLPDDREADKKRILELESVVGFYAARHNWVGGFCPSTITLDAGALARSVLGPAWSVQTDREGET